MDNFGDYIGIGIAVAFILFWAVAFYLRVIKGKSADLKD